jgi:hypothetical protein
MGEPRNATLIERLKRLLGGDVGGDVVQPGLLTSLATYPGEVARRDANLSRMKNTALARSKELERRRKAAREQRLNNLNRKAYEKYLFETYDDLGGVPEGRPSYIKGNTFTHPMEILNESNLHDQMSKPGGKIEL